MTRSGSYLLIIAAGGYATRALPLTGYGAKMKALVNAGVDGATVLEMILREAERSGIEHVVTVVSSEEAAQAVERFLDPFGQDPDFAEYLMKRGKTAEMEQIRALPRFKCAECVVQTEPRGFGDATALAADVFFAEEFDGACVALGDDVVHAASPAMAQLISGRRSLGGTVAAVQRVSKEEASRFGVVLVESEPIEMPNDFTGRTAYRVLDMEEKPADPSPNMIDGEETYLAVAGRYAISADDMRFLAGAEGAVHQELDFTALLRRNAASGSLSAVELDGHWHSVGSPLDAQKAFLRYALIPESGQAGGSHAELRRYAQSLLDELDSANPRP